MALNGLLQYGSHGCYLHGTVVQKRVGSGQRTNMSLWYRMIPQAAVYLNATFAANSPAGLLPNHTAHFGLFCPDLMSGSTVDPDP